MPLLIVQSKKKKSVLPLSGPGPTESLQYDPATDTGYYGFVPSTDFIDGPTLASQVGFSAGTAHNNDAGWLKFYVGPNAVCNVGTEAYVIFVARQTLRRSLGWSNIDSAGLRTGNTTTVISGYTYRVRLLTGGETTPGTGSEWNELLYRVHTEQPEGKSNWDTYDDAGLNVGNTDNGRMSWAQERPSGKFLNRGYFLSYWTATTSSTAHKFYGWRPVLELVA